MLDLDAIDVRYAVTDAPIGDEAVKVKCPMHADNEFSLAVYRNHLHCYGCRFHVKRTMDSLAFLLYGNMSEDSVRRAFEVAPKYTASALDGYRTRVAEEARREPLPSVLAQIYNNMLTGGNSRAWRRSWLHQRGLTDQTINGFELGHDGTRFTIPYFARDHKLLTIRYRRDDHYGTEYTDGKPIPKYIGTKGRNGLYLYPEFKLDVWRGGTWPELVVVEGEFDAIRLWQERIPSVTIPNGAGNLKRIPQMLADADILVDWLTVAGDMDEPGWLAAEEVVVAARTINQKVRRICWDPTWGKDATELYVNGHSLKEVM